VSVCLGVDTYACYKQKAAESYFNRAAVRRTSFSCLFEFIFSAKYLHRPSLHSARLAQKRGDAIANDFRVIHFIMHVSLTLSRPFSLYTHMCLSLSLSLSFPLSHSLPLSPSLSLSLPLSLSLSL